MSGRTEGGVATPRFRSGYFKELGSGARCPCHSIQFKARPPRPAGAFAPDGWAGFVPSGLPAPIGQGSGVPGALPARPSPGPGSGAGLATRQAAPPSRDRPGHRRPPRHPGPEPGSRKGDGGIMREAVGCGISRGGEKCGSTLSSSTLPTPSPSHPPMMSREATVVVS